MAKTKSLGTVSTVDVAITTVGVCYKIQVFEDAQAGTTDFKFKGNGSTDYVTYPSGKQLEISSPPGYPYAAGVTIGYIQRVGADASFVQLETP